MSDLSTKENAHTTDDSADQFRQLLMNYIQAVGRYYEANKSVQVAMKSLEKTFKKPH